jgi:archaemetzincin
MKLLQLLPIGNLDGELLMDLGPALADTFRIACEVITPALDPEFAYHGERQQYHSSELLQHMQGRVTTGSWRVLGVTSLDLYIPILTFVFGEAQMGGPCAVVSAHRLRQDFYGLPKDRDMLRQRLLKESVHEIGHTLNLSHCDDYNCVMAPSHAVEWIDLKERGLCTSCQGRVDVGSGSGLLREAR